MINKQIWAILGIVLLVGGFHFLRTSVFPQTDLNQNFQTALDKHGKRNSIFVCAIISFLAGLAILYVQVTK